jgi:thiol:disulfide interchange protein DsbC
MKVIPALLLAVLVPLHAYSQTPVRAVPPPASAAKGAPAAVPASTTAAAAVGAKSTDPRVELAAKIPGTKVEDLRPTPVPGIFELTHGAEISYVSSDGKYLFSGDLYRVADNGDFPNLSAPRRQELRAKLIGEVPEAEMVIFGPKDAKYTITVFTDVDCPWCRRLHSEMADYNKAGIRVRYLAWPRTGPATESWARAQGVWCAANRAETFTRASKGEAVKTATCAQDPVKRHYELGQELGVRGTPGVVLPDGELVPGYVAAAELLKHLQSLSAAK